MSQSAVQSNSQLSTFTDRKRGYSESDDTDRPAPTPAVKKTKAVSLASDDVIDAIAELHVIIKQQSDEMNQLRAIVERQQSHIELLLTIVGVSPSVVQSSTTDQLTPSPTPAQPDPGVLPPSSSSSSSQPSLGPSSSSSYANVLGPSPTGPGTSQLTFVRQFKTAIVSAVYRDIDDKTRRARNIIVNGLPETTDDHSAVKQLINDEFSIQPDIVRCRRLGKPRHDRVRPLLVICQNESDAEHLKRHAKRLRHSTNDTVRSKVFINADVTQAEALALYQKRVEKRQRAAHHLQQQQPSTAAASTLHPNATTFVPTSLPPVGVDLVPSPLTLSSSSSTGVVGGGPQ